MQPTASLEVAAELKSAITADFRTGFVLPDPTKSTVDDSLLRGWNTWIEYSKATTIGIPAGDRFFRLSHTSTFISNTSASCSDYVAAAQALMEQQKVLNYQYLSI